MQRFPQAHAAHTILITGCSGLIGSHVAARLLNKGYPCRGIDRRAQPTPVEGLSFTLLDILDASNRQRAIEGVQGCIHLAAITRIADGERDPERCVRTNVRGTADLLDDLSQLESPPWLVYGSSREVYGNPRCFPVREAHPLQPINVYGRTKADAERLVGEYATRTGRPAIIFRFSNVYGGVHDYQDRVVPAFVLAALDGKPMVIQGSDKSFDFTHVDDVSSVLLQAVDCLENGSLRGLTTLNVTTGRETSLLELAELISGAAGTKADVTVAPSHTFDVTRFVGDPRQLEKVLNLRCEIGIREGILQYIDTYRQHRKGNNRQ